MALGVDMRAAMDQLGHSHAAFTLRVYTHGMRSDEQSRRALRELVGTAAIGQQSGSSPVLTLGAMPGSPVWAVLDSNE